MVESFRNQTDPRVQEMRRHLADCLRLVGSVVEFRLEQTSQPEAREQLGWVLDKVTAIALVQQRLADEPDFAPYLRQVAEFWQRNSGRKDVAISCRADPADLTPEHSGAMAVAVHELVANAVRHGFPAGRGGTVTIDLTLEEDRIELAVRDDGAGLADRGIAFKEGLRLVERLAAQLDGQFNLQSDEGTVARLVLPRPGTPAE